VLHWLEYRDCAERDSERFADIVQILDGQFDVVLPRPDFHTTSLYDRKADTWECDWTLKKTES
jgi:hypothetical protein